MARKRSMMHQQADVDALATAFDEAVVEVKPKAAEFTHRGLCSEGLKSMQGDAKLTARVSERPERG